MQCLRLHAGKARTVSSTCSPVPLSIRPGVASLDARRAKISPMLVGWLFDEVCCTKRDCWLDQQVDRLLDVAKTQKGNVEAHELLPGQLTYDAATS
jgi:hypothetical protein